jgi:hypothetical protein
MADGTTIKLILMVMLMGGIIGATYVPEARAALPMFLARTMAVVWSAMALLGRSLQYMVLKCVPSPTVMKIIVVAAVVASCMFTAAAFGWLINEALSL